MDAKTIQTTLSRLRYYHGAIDGDLTGADCRAAVKKFQADKGLVVDGIFGNASEAVLAKFFSPNMPPLEELRRVRLTHYYVAEEVIYPGTRVVPVYNATGQLLTRVSARMFAAMALEGTGRTLDGRMFNVSGRTLSLDPTSALDYDSVYNYAKQQGWIPNKANYAGLKLTPDGLHAAAVSTFNEIPPNMLGSGYGIQHGLPLVPGRSLATDIGAYRLKNDPDGWHGSSDPRYYKKGGLVPVGTHVLIVDAIGLALPSKPTHDGSFIAHDTGGAIFGMHYDVFSGNADLARQIKLPPVGHTWFSGITQRVPEDYTYGLTKM